MASPKQQTENILFRLQEQIGNASNGGCVSRFHVLSSHPLQLRTTFGVRAFSLGALLKGELLLTEEQSYKRHLILGLRISQMTKRFLSDRILLPEGRVWKWCPDDNERAGRDDAASKLGPPFFSVPIGSTCRAFFKNSLIDGSEAKGRILS